MCSPLVCLSTGAWTETVVRTISVAIRPNPLHAVLSMVGIGAYDTDTTSRSSMLQGLVTVPMANLCLPFVIFCIFSGQPARYIWHDQTGQPHMTSWPTNSIGARRSNSTVAKTTCGVLQAPVTFRLRQLLGQLPAHHTSRPLQHAAGPLGETRPQSCANSSLKYLIFTQPSLHSKQRSEQQAPCRPPAGTLQAGKASSMAPCHPL